MNKLFLFSSAALACAVSSNAFAQEQPATTPNGDSVDANGSATVTTAPTTTTREYDDSASDTTSPERRGIVRAPKKALEIGVEGGYTQPFGKLNDGRNIGDLADAGGAVGLSVGYRFNPHWSLGVTGQFHDSSADANLGSGADVRGLAAGLLGTLHILPYSRVDPYVAVGTGYRVMWVAPQNADNDMIHGLELGRAILGVDFRVSKDVAVGPMIGADVDMFLWDNPESTEGNVAIDSPRPTTFVFAGAAARFDLGGRRVPENQVAAIPAATPASAPPVKRTVHPVEEPGTTGIQIEQDIMSQCKIEGPAAFFQFDSAKVQSTAVPELDQVATCFTTGPLQGRHLQIVGHTDPRGTDRYNMILGESRGESVQKYLAGHGVDHIVVVSRGEEDATGNDENGWAYDRRVDLRLEK
jgi:outer membrane protein OmpA-like peptidoglycan-associated protein